VRPSLPLAKNGHRVAAEDGDGDGAEDEDEDGAVDGAGVEAGAKDGQGPGFGFWCSGVLVLVWQIFTERRPLGGNLLKLPYFSTLPEKERERAALIVPLEWLTVSDPCDYFVLMINLRGYPSKLASSRQFVMIVQLHGEKCGVTMGEVFTIYILSRVRKQ